MNKRDWPERIAELYYTVHLGIAQEIWNHAYFVTEKRTLMVVGAARGKLARLAAWMFDSACLHMVDITNKPDPFEPICPEYAHTMDILSEEFVRKFEGKIDHLLCFMVVHELEDPELGIRNMLKCLSDKPDSHLWILDMSGYRFTALKGEDIAIHPEEYHEEIRRDLENVQRHKLDDQDYVFALYERIADELGATILSSRIMGEQQGASDVYEIVISNKPNLLSEATM